MSKYLLRYNGILRPFESASSIGKNKILRLLKPADDRRINNGFRVDERDYQDWRVMDTNTVTQEHPAGGLEDITILDLERVNYARPDEPPVALGG